MIRYSLETITVAKQTIELKQHAIVTSELITEPIANK